MAMKLMNKKIMNNNHMTKTINKTIPNTTINSLKNLHFFSVQNKSFYSGETYFNGSEEKAIEIEAELKRAQARTYASFTPFK
jgi:hypothetical protein